MNDFDLFDDTCPDCSGTGYDDGQCHTCGGTGSPLHHTPRPHHGEWAWLDDLDDPQEQE
ncbi:MULTISPECIES: hypothetical protein [unclassified Deinococcus]|uniref:hypothetical protein n=1 Tax=unclassified Deinococcus TaxID=2623546 RepID=UPI000ACD122D|nr:MULTISPECIES: hypothetical protein [unclassified Deinococcus]MCD0170205.1 hypothetical protein [Deinococcus sp. 23YEL01]